MGTDTNNKSYTLVEVIEGGPLKVTGQIILKDSIKEISDSLDEVYLCRCGRSCNKPYCDESHKH
jgi:CDGSH-type Zn-finger protein